VNRTIVVAMCVAIEQMVAECDGDDRVPPAITDNLTAIRDSLDGGDLDGALALTRQTQTQIDAWMAAQ
jgi:hypothetical protein